MLWITNFTSSSAHFTDENFLVFSRAGSIHLLSISYIEVIYYFIPFFSKLIALTFSAVKFSGLHCYEASNNYVFKSCTYRNHACQNSLFFPLKFSHIVECQINMNHSKLHQTNTTQELCYGVGTVARLTKLQFSFP